MNDEIRNTSFYRTGEWCVLTEKEKPSCTKIKIKTRKKQNNFHDNVS